MASDAQMIDIQDVSKRYGERVAVDRLSLRVARGEVLALVGGSGSGKTTTLKLINRLVEPSSGSIAVAGKDTREIAPHELRRTIGYVLQGVGLFPHLTVAENIGTVPKLLGWDDKKIAKRSEELLELVSLEPAMARRYPAQLSGGQRQRVGVARALAADPPLLLMDEPFGAIDPINRTRLQEEFRKLQADLGKTVIFVTHDIDEALKLGNHIAVIRPGGVLAQFATPEELVAAPADDFVKEFVGVDRMVARLEWLQEVRETRGA
jgi:osmoprotectant transport system ATP-binding protein